ncbi:murinoglobulin-2-like [Physella acuta]|uniref:murinoglobulin-2-like n=1 Tax=Physella acuta TaxID=109671 RepID=UPI0027DD1BAB|nr:murinoglobulin-2-like [Physella acuta]XP_059144000.1 murinoglobulin-2-like [Physella acuta]
MSEYAKQTYSNNLNLHITATLESKSSFSTNKSSSQGFGIVSVSSQSEASSTFTVDIDKSNSLLVQTSEITSLPAKLTIIARGSGVALVEAAVFFNVLSEIEAITFDLKVKIVEETLNLLILETCTAWRGNGQSSGMAVQELGIPSGFDADLESITKLDILKRVETQNKKVILYFDKIGTTPVCLNLRVRRVDFVAKSQPAAVRVYDYYEPRNQVTVFYQSKILEDSSICDVCKDCISCA